MAKNRIPKLIEVSYEAEYCTLADRPGLRGTFKRDEIQIDYPYRNGRDSHTHTERIHGQERGRLDAVAEGIVMALGGRPAGFEVSWIQMGSHKCACGRSHFVQYRKWTLPATPKRVEAARAFCGDSKAQEEDDAQRHAKVETFWTDLAKSRLYYETMEAEAKASAAPVPAGA